MKIVRRKNFWGGAMMTLIAGLLVFLGVHLVPALGATREKAVQRLGAGGYKLVFSALSLIGLVLIVYGYQAARGDPANIELWAAPAWTKHVAILLMLPAMIFLVASQIPSRIRTGLKHPMLAGIKTWALAHLIANGDLASVVLFGSFLAYAVFDRISLKRRGTAGPLGDKTGGPMSDAVVIAIGVALYAVLLLWGHEALIGVPVLP